jgi:hypoxanthine phosphoribosyltransferase
MNREEAQQLIAHSDEIVNAAAVNEAIARMAQDIGAALGDSFPLVLSVMGGAAVFTGMLLPHLAFPLEFDYIHLTRYSSAGVDGPETHWRVAPRESVKDRVVLVLDDLLDDGKTMAAIRDRVLEMGASRFLCAVLCEKDLPQAKPLQPDFSGFTVPNRYVFGCGMDVKGYWRNLPGIRALNAA